MWHVTFSSTTIIHLVMYSVLIVFDGITPTRVTDILLVSGIYIVNELPVTEFHGYVHRGYRIFGYVNPGCESSDYVNLGNNSLV